MTDVPADMMDTMDGVTTDDLLKQAGIEIIITCQLSAQIKHITSKDGWEGDTSASTEVSEMLQAREIAGQRAYALWSAATEVDAEKDG